MLSVKTSKHMYPVFRHATLTNKFHILIIKQMQLGADIQGNKKTSKYFDSFLWPVIHLGQSTNNLL